jgi:DNA sulfur modification protein DndC
MPEMKQRKTAFRELGLKKSIEIMLDEIRELYLVDEVPWVIGYSGGKDSTAILQLIWYALGELKPEQLHKPVHVISTDTLVENPVVAAWVGKSLTSMREAAKEQGLPLQAHRLTPEVENSFWVNLLGKGYPAPRHKFRWCTERLKIMPSGAFIEKVVKSSGEAILVLGIRKAESSMRASVMSKHEKGRVRDKLSPNASLPNSLIYSPIEDWVDDDVWLYLMQYKNPWGYTNKALLTMYSGATADGECPLVVDTSTPSCGDSRFGCWVCTMVGEDKSMAAMIQNDHEKQWMAPLLKFRARLVTKNEKGKWDDRLHRDYRRMNGSLTVFNERLVHGPYKQSVREEWLLELLKTQKGLSENAPEDIRDVDLISLDELEEIRRIWVVEKHELEDNLPLIYEEALGVAYPASAFHESSAIGRDGLGILKELCPEDGEQYALIRGLLDVEQRYRTMTKRKGLYGELERILNFYQYDDEAHAEGIAIAASDKRGELQEEILPGSYIAPISKSVAKARREADQSSKESGGTTQVRSKR